jgi:hypothetical protein
MPYINNEWSHVGYAAPSTPVPPPTAPAVTFSDGDAFEVADAKQRYAARRFAEYSAQLDAMPNIDPRSKAAALESFAQTPAARDAIAAVDAAQAYRDELAAQPAAAQATLTTPHDAGAQLAAQRQWDGARSRLDQSSTVGEDYTAARKMVDGSTAAELNVLNEELTGYLESRGQPTSWVGDAISAKSAPVAHANEAANIADRKLRKLQHNSRLTETAYKNHKPVDSRMILDVS